MKKNKPEDNTVHLLYKNLGETPNEAVLKFKKENPEYRDLPMTYAGRLDPMAEGLLIILSGLGILEKDRYLDLSKTYEAEILWGFQTDTADLLGKVMKFESYKVDIEEIKKYLKKSVGKFEQSYPAYSSKPVNGKPLFGWAREGRINEIQIPKHEVEIFEVNYVSRRFISKKELLKDISQKISLVKGDFRQKEILDKWKKVLKETDTDEFAVDRISLRVSSGFYVRQFISDLAENFNTKAVTFHIKRVKVGDYSL